VVDDELERDAKDETVEEEWTLDELECAAEDAEMLRCALDELEWVAELG
jgi:hypothetical protein